MLDTSTRFKLDAWIERKKEKVEDIEAAIAAGNQDARLPKLKSDITAEISKLKASVAKQDRE